MRTRALVVCILALTRSANERPRHRPFTATARGKRLAFAERDLRSIAARRLIDARLLTDISRVHRASPLNSPTLLTDRGQKSTMPSVRWSHRSRACQWVRIVGPASTRRRRLSLSATDSTHSWADVKPISLKEKLLVWVWTQWWVTRDARSANVRPGSILPPRIAEIVWRLMRRSCATTPGSYWRRASTARLARVRSWPRRMRLMLPSPSRMRGTDQRRPERRSTLRTRARSLSSRGRSCLR